MSETLALNTIRTLAMDAVQAANSGHPGTPMALAPVAYVLFNERMKYDPAPPLWPSRDKFVLSIGHASTLLYSLLHLCGVEQVDANGNSLGKKAVTIDDLKTFRQWGSQCAGHPEYRHTSGVEVTTGPLGQGVATSVGMAIASDWISANFDKNLFNSNVYALCGDGDMMEGISGEAASLAGHLQLSNLCWIYDDNGITIEGNTSLAFGENVAERFTAYGWNVVKVADVNDLNALRSAFDEFEAETARPTLIIVKSVIGYGSPNKAGSHTAHGAPLGVDEVRLTKQALDWDPDKSFYVPEEVKQMFKCGIVENGAREYSQWEADFAAYCKANPEKAALLKDMFTENNPLDWDKFVEVFPTDAKGMASRASSGKVLNECAEGLPWLVGGSADLAPSNNTWLKFENAGEFSPANREGRNFHFGIREHAMGAICNGLTLSGLRGFCATFFVFCDYLRPAIRLASLMGLPNLYVFTHDSIGVGEDGPTHQPVEQLASLRCMPNLAVVRPADANEVAWAYKTALNQHTQPTCMILTRQNLPTLDRATMAPAELTAKGAYVLSDCQGTPEIILIGTGSEVGICLDAQKTLTAAGKKVRVVSMPCWEWFDAQTQDYKNSVLPSECKNRVAVEAALPFGWSKYIGDQGKFIGMNGFGASAPFARLMKEFGITAEAVVAAASQE